MEARKGGTTSSPAPSSHTAQTSTPTTAFLLLPLRQHLRRSALPTSQKPVLTPTPWEAEPSAAAQLTVPVAVSNPKSRSRSIAGWSAKSASRQPSSRRSHAASKLTQPSGRRTSRLRRQFAAQDSLPSSRRDHDRERLPKRVEDGHRIWRLWVQGGRSGGWLSVWW